MKKIAKMALIMAICVVCVGCGNDEVENNNLKDEVSGNITNTTNTEENINLQEELEINDYDYVEGITEPVRIEETEDELRVNVKGNVTSIYKCSGDIVIDWYEKNYFDTNEAAQIFADEQEDKSKVSIKDKVVILKVEIPEGTVMKKSDLINTYSALKGVYENEQ